MCFKHGSCSLSRHGHCKDQDVQDGIERGIGNGRRSSADASDSPKMSCTVSDCPQTMWVWDPSRSRHFRRKKMFL